MRRAVVMGAFLWVAATARPARADGHYFDGVFETLFLMALPSSVGGSIEWRRDGFYDAPVLLSWSMQIPLSCVDGCDDQRDYNPTYRLALDPTIAIGTHGVDFQLRVAPRMVLVRGDAVALFVSAGTTAKFAPFSPSAHAEVGLLSQDVLGDNHVWIALRGDAWFGDERAQRLALAVGWSLW